MRRGFGRPLRRAFAANIPPLLQRANQEMTNGNYTDAATDFEQLARAADARGGPRAPLFYIQAGRAKIMAGQTGPGMEFLERGLGLFAMRGQLPRASNFGARIISELTQRGLSKETRKITDYLKNLVPGFDESSQGNMPAKRPPLPTHCPGCGAPVRPDEVEWLDEVTAECAFCGSPVRES
jgi:hypothetical protein